MTVEEKAYNYASKLVKNSLTASEVAAHYGRGYIEGQEDMKHLGWHPASELPIVPKGEDEVEVYCLVRGKGLTVLVPMKLHYTVSHGFGVSSKNIEIKWWCYPPKED